MGLVESLSRNRILDFSEIDGGRLIYLVTETFAKRRSVVRIDLGVVGRTRDGDVGKATADEFGVNVCVHIHEDAFRCKTLRAVRGYGVTVIEVPHLPGIERDGSVLTSIQRSKEPKRQSSARWYAQLEEVVGWWDIWSISWQLECCGKLIHGFYGSSGPPVTGYQSKCAVIMSCSDSFVQYVLFIAR